MIDRHERASPRPGGDQTVAHEHADRLADRAQAHIELGREPTVPGQLLTRGQLARLDLAPKLHGDPRRESLADDAHER